MLTSEDIWELFRETDRRFQETDERFKEVIEQFKENDRKFEERFKETDKEFKELSRKFEETDEEFKEIARRFKETDERFKETDEKFKETQRLIERLSRKWDEQWGRFGNRLGEFVESMVAPAALRLFQERNIKVDQLYRELEGRHQGVHLEVDLLVANTEEVVVIEVKSKLSVEDVNDHLERLEKFRRVFHNFAQARVLGAVAAMVMSEEIAKYAYRRGLFVIAQSGNTVHIFNDEQFVPKVW